MKTRSTLIATGVALGIALASAGSSQAQTVVDPGPSYPGPRIISVGVAKYRPADNTVVVPITYRCTDRPAPGGTQHWISVSVGDSWSAPDRRWSAGWRNGPGGLVRAQCTGARITHRLVLRDFDGYSVPEPPSTTPVRSGYQPVEVDLYQTASQDWAGGWYHRTGPRTGLDGSVYLRSPLG